MADRNDTREQGVEFGETVDSLSYPIDHDELLARHGDAELELPDGTTTLEEVLEPLQDDERTYRDRDELETMVKNMVGESAVGREGYSDRGTSNEPDRDDEESL